MMDFILEALCPHPSPFSQLSQWSKKNSSPANHTHKRHTAFHTYCEKHLPEVEEHSLNSAEGAGGDVTDLEATGGGVSSHGGESGTNVSNKRSKVSFRNCATFFS